MDCKNSSLCIFDKPGVLTDIQFTKTIDNHPINTVTQNGPIEFMIRGSSEDYIDLGSISVYVAFKILHEDGTTVDQSKDVVGLNNLSIAALFSDAFLTIGETQIEGGSADYAYRGYFRTVMQFPPAAQTSTMLAMGWYKDQAGKFDDKSNTGFVQRQNLVGSSNLIELEGPLYFDFFNQNRHLINQTDIRIKLLPQKPEFLLNAYYPAPATGTSPPKFKVNFEKIIVYCDRLEMNPSVINGHAVGLNRQNARYYINHADLFTDTIPSGQMSYIKPDLFSDLSPKMVMIAMVDNDAFNGDIKKNPFNFQHYDLDNFELSRGGRSIPGVAMTPNFDTKQYLRSYLQTMKAFNYVNTDDTNGLKPEEWANGYTIFAFDLTPDKEASSGCLHAHVGNSFRLKLNFKKALPHTINVLVYAISDSQVEITKLRDVITHYKR